MAMRYISDIVSPGDIKSGVFNLIDAGCGSGKTYFCINHLFNVIPDLEPSDVVVITSRSITAKQMEMNVDVSVKHVLAKELFNEDERMMIDKGITVMTYDAAPKYLMMVCSGECVNKPKVIVVDECHTLFVDRFIKDIGYVVALLNLMILSGDVIVIGLTATSNIVRQYCSDAFTYMVDVCDKIPTRYPAKNLVMTKMKYVPGYLKDVSGKTIIIVPYTRDADYLNRVIPNSAIVVSKSRRSDDVEIPYESYMDDIRNCIINNRSLPDMITTRNRITNTLETHKLDVLIATTTFREGFNLDEISGVKNVVCCFTDDIHITQFLGRCRYSVDNLIIAPPDKMQFNHKYSSYFEGYFDEYMECFYGISRYWFDSISSLVSCKFEDVQTFTCNTEYEQGYRNFNDAIKELTDGSDLSTDDMKYIVDCARKFGVLSGVRKSKYSKNNVIPYLESEGYEVSCIKDKNRNSSVVYRIVKITKENLDNPT